MIIRTNDREISLAEYARHVVQPEIKLMIPDGGRIITHFVHQLYFHIPFIQIVISRTL